MVNNNIEKEIFDSLRDPESRRVTRDEYLLNRKNSINPPKQAVNYPDAKWHQIVSFIKSGVRIFGYVLIPLDLGIAASVLVVSEIIGIVEELV